MRVCFLKKNENGHRRLLPLDSRKIALWHKIEQHKRSFVRKHKTDLFTKIQSRFSKLLVRRFRGD